MYFVVLSAEVPIPLVDKDYALRVFARQSDAELAAETTLLGRAYGYTIFEWERE
jgi:hypothetical protein